MTNPNPFQPLPLGKGQPIVRVRLSEIVGLIDRQLEEFDVSKGATYINTIVRIRVTETLKGLRQKLTELRTTEP